MMMDTNSPPYSDIHNHNIAAAALPHQSPMLSLSSNHLSSIYSAMKYTNAHAAGAATSGSSQRERDIMTKHRLSTTFNYNEKKVLFVLVLLLGGDQAFAFQASSKALALDLSRHHSQFHLQCENNNLSTRERQKGHYPISIARTSLCIHRNHATSARWGATSSRNNHDNFALSMSQNDGNNDDTTIQSASETELRREFDRLDINKSGAIDKAEVTYFINFVPKAIIDKIYPLADTNNDGVIDFDEYKSIRRAMGVSPRLRLDDLLNIPIVELGELYYIIYSYQKSFQGVAMLCIVFRIVLRTSYAFFCFCDAISDICHWINPIS